MATAMAVDIRKVKDLHGLVEYFSAKLGWDIDFDDFDEIEDITYDFDAADIGLKEEAFAKISALRQLPPLVDGQRWGIFSVEFDSKRFEVTALRKILSGLIPKRRNSADHAVWDQQDLLFLCFWGQGNERTIGVAHFAEQETGLPQIRINYCAPAVEDFTQIAKFESQLAQLAWPDDPANTEDWREQWSAAFKVAYRQTITDSSMLTIQLAVEAQDIRDRILEALEVETEKGYVHTLYEKFKNTLIHDMTEQQFADMYAQTVVYGLFSARCMDSTQEDFSAAEAVECIPNTNPFLKHLMQECLGAQANSRLSFDELEIGDVVELLRHTQTDSIIQDFNRQTGGGREDPVIHFYEEFLTAYDKAQKVQRGVFYTPQPAVNFIVRAVDDLLKNEFGVSDGLASTDTKKIRIMRNSKKKIDGYYRQVEDVVDVPAVQVLDPSTGTGTFLRQVILQMYSNYHDMVKAGKATEEGWSAYVEEHLLPRLNGFELMMAPYAVAHMKLAMVLKDTGYNFASDARLNLFLTNTLEKPGSSEAQMALWDDPLATESIEANGVKKNKGINVILGNPPYSGVSSNNGEWITELIEDYKYINGVHFGERKHWLQDDYVKFIRFGENVLDESGSGILAFINNHAFLDNPTFRCMRYHLLQTFDQIYIINLHGNSLIGERAEDGGKDENVFDIQQGVSINIFVKRQAGKKGQLATVNYKDVYGERSAKYAWLWKTGLESIEWTTLDPIEPYYFFVKRDLDYANEYNAGFPVQDLFRENVMGITTARDFIVIDSDYDTLLNRIVHFCDPALSDEQIRAEFFPGKLPGKYLPGDTRGWQLSNARKAIRNNDHSSFIRRIAYRPFDYRYIYYCHDMVDWDREKVMKHFILGENVGLSLIRINRDDLCTALVTDDITDKTVLSSKDNANTFPLFLYYSEGGRLKRIANLDPDMVKRIADAVGMKFVDEKAADEDSLFDAYDILDYIYAVLHSPSYRERYKDFIKSEFPRIVYPTSPKMFREFAKIGKQLRMIHLMRNVVLDTEMHQYHGDAQGEVEKGTYSNGRVYINRTSYFDNVDEETWNSFIAGYQPLQKWLKDRKGTELGRWGIQHYQKIICSVEETAKLMQALEGIETF